LAAENIMLAARALGYGSVMITGSVSAETVRRFFKVPRRYMVNCLIPIWALDSWPVKRERRPLPEFVFHERVPRRTRKE
jgi:5,6-dimethylbenzimidazole synthase